MGHGTFSVTFVAPLMAHAHALGIETDDLLTLRGLSPATFADPDARIDFDTAIDFSDALAERVGAPDFALRVASRLPHGALDLHEYLLRSSETLEAGLRRMARFLKLVSPSGLEVRTTRDELQIVSVPPRLLFHQWHEYALGAYLTLVRRAAGEALVPMRVEFMNSRPGSRTMLDETFRCPVSFACSVNKIVFPRALGDAKLPGRDERALKLFEHYAKIKLAGMTDATNVIDRVQRALAQLRENGTMEADKVARLTGMSKRSLQRALRDEGTSLRALIDVARRELAIQHVRWGTLPLGEIASLLEFSDASAFHRSFRRWTGQTPRMFRATSQRGPST